MSYLGESLVIMEHSDEELHKFEDELMPAVERILTLLDGDSEGGGFGTTSVDQETYRDQIALLKHDLFLFLMNNPQLDHGYRMEIVNILSWQSYPETNEEREFELRTLSISLSDLISVEAFAAQDQLDYWKVHNEGRPRGVQA